MKYYSWGLESEGELLLWNLSWGEATRLARRYPNFYLVSVSVRTQHEDILQSHPRLETQPRIRAEARVPSRRSRYLSRSFRKAIERDVTLRNTEGEQ